MKVKVKPKKKLRVKDPITMIPLNPEGELKEESTYWRRRAIDGDVTITRNFAKSTIKKEKE